MFSVNTFPELVNIFWFSGEISHDELKQNKQTNKQTEQNYAKSINT